MLPFTKNVTTLVGTAHPADNATDASVVPAASKSLVANDYESLVVRVGLVDPVVGSKSIAVTLWTKDTADGTVGDGTWTEVVPDENLFGSRTLLAATGGSGAAIEAVYEYKVPMRLFSKKYAAAKAAIACVDPSAAVATFAFVEYEGEIARRA
jgi:hypothetical protein